MKFRNPHLVNTIFPKDPRVILNAIEMALKPFGDENKDPRYLQTLLKQFDKVIPEMSTYYRDFKQMVAGSDWFITPFDQANQVETEIVTRRIKHFFQEIVDTYVDGYLYGSALIEINWVQTTIGWKPELSRRFSPEEIEFDRGQVHDINILKLIDLGRFERQRIKPEFAYNFLAYHYHDQKEPGGILMKLIFVILFYRISESEWQQFLPKLKGIIQGIVKNTASQTDKAAADGIMQNAIDNNYILSSEHVSFQLHSLANALSGKTYEERIIKLEESAQVAITGTKDNITDRERGAATVLERKQNSIANWERQRLEKFINHFLMFDYFLNNNRDQTAEIPYEFRFKPKLTSDQESNMRKIEVGINSLGQKIQLKELNEKTGINFYGNPDDVIENTEDLKEDLPGFDDLEIPEDAS